MTDERAFELYLMSQMRGEAAIAAALTSLGSTPEALRGAAERMAQEVGFDRVGHGIDLYRRTLGEPLETSVEPGLDSTEGYAGSLRHRFHLPLWPAFDFIVRSHRDGWAWGPGFVRRSGGDAPHADGPDALAPWSILEPEVREQFGPFTTEDAWNFGKDGSYVVDRSGRSFEVSLVFDFDLLQRVTAS
jgi:hypothetical protein